jgi:hypothetical protein
VRGHSVNFAARLKLGQRTKDGTRIAAFVRAAFALEHPGFVARLLADPVCIWYTHL